MPKRKETMVAIGLGILGLILAVTWAVVRNSGKENVHAPAVITPYTSGHRISGIALTAAPAEVQDAAEKLRTSRVGYAMAQGDLTYLIISTGNTGDTISLETTQIMSDMSDVANVNLTSGGAGQSLIIATTDLAGTDFQFNVDGVYAAIPTLINRDNLPLIHLGDGDAFAVVSPLTNQMIAGTTLHVEGYARVFEAQFTVKVLSAKGRVLGTAHVAAAAGAPNWGSFSADVTIETANLPDTGYVVFEDGSADKRFVVPVRFPAARPAQLG